MKINVVVVAVVTEPKAAVMIYLKTAWKAAWLTFERAVKMHDFSLVIVHDFHLKGTP